jgi:very-short-patch-repair endonuclease
MSRKSPLEKIIDAAAERMADFVRLHHDYATDAESPIEAILHAAIITEFHLGCLDHSHSFGFLYEVGTMDECEIYDRANAGRVSLMLWAQAPILNYRADILIMSKNLAGQWMKLVVECDGHDFHERTKEQAAKDRSRDREMQGAGYTVFRFTGAEIYRDPVKCAQQVVAWADKAIFG